MAARARFTCGSGGRDNLEQAATIPTRGISVMIRPKIFVFRSSDRNQRRLALAGSIFTACRIRNMQTAQFEIQRE